MAAVVKSDINAISNTKRAISDDISIIFKNTNDISLSKFFVVYHCGPEKVS